MRKLSALLSVLSVALLLAACTNVHTNTAPPVTPNESQNPTIPIPSQPALPQDIDRQLSEKYVDVTRLAALDIDIEEKYVFDDRIIELEDTIDNEPEQLAYQYYYNQASAQLDDLLNLIGENEPFQNAVNSEINVHNRGDYMSRYIIHELTLLSADDLPKINEDAKMDILDKMDTFGFTEYAVVQVDVSWEHNEISLSQSPQLGDGRYMRYYLFAKTMNVPQFKLYDFYWEYFILT